MVLRWIGLIAFACVLAVVFVQLGQWQLRRLDERKAHNVAVRTAEAAPVADWRDYFTRPLTEADEWHQVRIEGTYLTDRQYVVRFRSNGEAKGYEVITPLRTADGTVVLVDRGFVAVAPGVPLPTTAPPAPSGTVTVVGRVRIDEKGGPGAEDPNAGQVRVVNSAKIGRDLGIPVAQGWLQLTSVTPAQDPSFVPVALPTLDEGPHLSYAVQWFLFTAVGVIGVAMFIRADLRDRRKERARAARKAARAAETGAEPERTPEQDQPAAEPEHSTADAR